MRWLLLGDDLLRLISLSPLAASHWCLDVDDLATCSDAAESGGGVCASTGLSELGLERLGEAESLRSRSPADALLLVDAFSGISAARRALQLLGVAPGSHISLEVDEVAQSIVASHFQGARELGDITEVTIKKLKEAVADNPHIKHILLVAGFPCQDLSGANPAAKGLTGNRSSLLHQALGLLRELLPAAFPGIEIEAILENVSSMKAAYRDEISALCDTAPYKLCPSDVWPDLRPRFWWLTCALDNHRYLEIEFKDGYAKGRLLGRTREVKEFLPKGSQVALSFVAFPTFCASSD